MGPQRLRAAPGATPGLLPDGRRQGALWYRPAAGARGAGAAPCLPVSPLALDGALLAGFGRGQGWHKAAKPGVQIDVGRCIPPGRRGRDRQDAPAAEPVPPRRSGPAAGVRPGQTEPAGHAGRWERARPEPGLGTGDCVNLPSALGTGSRVRARKPQPSHQTAAFQCSYNGLSGEGFLR